jgi:hypothetical protein
MTYIFDFNPYVLQHLAVTDLIQIMHESDAWFNEHCTNSFRCNETYCIADELQAMTFKLMFGDYFVMAEVADFYY